MYFFQFSGLIWVAGGLSCTTSWEAKFEGLDWGFHATIWSLWLERNSRIFHDSGRNRGNSDWSLGFSFLGLSNVCLSRIASICFLRVWVFSSCLRIELYLYLSFLILIYSFCFIIEMIKKNKIKEEETRHASSEVKFQMVMNKKGKPNCSCYGPCNSKQNLM